MDKRQQYMRENTSESGVALVFALAMLALLLIMLIGFLASAIFEQRIAYNQSGQSITRTIARSALQHASNMLAVYDGIVDEIPAFTGYAEEENKSGSITDTTPAWRMTPLSSINHTDIENMGDAFDLIKKLLQNRGINPDNYVWDKEIGGKKNIPQWVPMIVKVGGEHSHITGRFAYTIIPNLGIEPNLLNDADPTKRIGLKYKELPFSGLELGSANWQRIFNQSKWMSLDVLGSKYVLGKDLDKTPWEKEMPDTVVARDDFRETEKTAYMELVNTFFTTDQDRSVDFDEDRINLAEVGTQANADKIADLIASDSTLKKQIAANIVDFVDKESESGVENEIPTSDVAPADWLTSTTHPTYTGNEKTPYLNQLAVKLKVDAEYKETHTEISGSDPARKKIKQELKVTVAPDVVAELINIYKHAFTAKSKVQLKDLTIEVTASIGEGTGKSIKHTFTINNPQTAEMTLGANSYASATLATPPAAKVLQFDPIEKEVANGDKADDIDLKITVDKIKFDRAVVIHNNRNVDYTQFDNIDKNYGLIDPLNAVAAPGEPGEPGTPADPSNPGEGGSTSTWTFTGSTTTPDPETKTETTTAFVNWEAMDPRCNLIAADSDTDYWKASDLQTQNDGTLPNIGGKNKDANPNNSNLTKEMDLEFTEDEDPKDLSTAYIRDGVMTSVWELGFIHRGKPWQTINLKSADHTKEKTYLNDAVLLDEIAFYDPDASADDKEKEKTKKYNINYPYTHIAAFGPLVKGLKYCPVDKTDIVDAEGLYPEEDGTSLNDDQWISLRKWIAWKCHKSKDGNPSKFDGAENYHFYRHRGYLANVITDWAVNSDDSPYKGEEKCIWKN